ncbi:MAG: radical SAM protein [Deltaproteobacteria bacterium]|nr:radical SAM protein [Deltaproteobacteria bacterium]
MHDQSPSYPLVSLYLYLSDQCNLSCRHCWISPGYSENATHGIPLEDLKNTILEAKTIGLQSVKLTGGEPLLYRDFNALLTFLAGEGIAVIIESNGTLFEHRILETLRLCQVDQIAVSLDAATKEIHDEMRGVRGSFDRTLQGLKLLSEYGFDFQIIMTLQRRNSQEIQGLVSLAKELGAGSLKINHLVPCGRGEQIFRNRENLSADELILLYQTVERERSSHGDLDVIFDLPVALRSIEDIKRRGIIECRILNILGILANGAFSICGIGQTMDELRMGNLYQDSIVEIWQNHRILMDLRDSLPRQLKGVCGNCLFRFQCLGACRANAYALNKDLYAPYFLCQESYESGRFPVSRIVQ